MRADAPSENRMHLNIFHWLGIIFWVVCEMWMLLHLMLIWNALTHIFPGLATFEPALPPPKTPPHPPLFLDCQACQSRAVEQRRNLSTRSVTDSTELYGGADAHVEVRSGKI